VLIAAGACAGIGFTVSILVSSLAFSGERLDEAKLGALATVVIAPLVAWLVTRMIRRLPSNLRARQIGRTAEAILDLVEDFDPERDHIRGPDDALVTLLEYGDFECPYCRQAERVIRELLSPHGDVRYVWRHLPLNDVHPTAQLASEAAEAAAAQGKFWEMYDTLLRHQEPLSMRDLARYATDLDLDIDRFTDELRRRDYAPRVSEDVASADESAVSGTPTFFINGRRHYGVYDINTLTDEVRAAKTRAQQLLTAAPSWGLGGTEQDLALRPGSVPLTLAFWALRRARLRWRCRSSFFLMSRSRVSVGLLPIRRRLSWSCSSGWTLGLYGCCGGSVVMRTGWVVANQFIVRFDRIRQLRWRSTVKELLCARLYPTHPAVAALPHHRRRPAPLGDVTTRLLIYRQWLDWLDAHDVTALSEVRQERFQ
jgi:protein-disulfide isomerase